MRSTSSTVRLRKVTSGVAGDSGRTVLRGAVRVSSLTLAAFLCILVTLYRLHSLGRFDAPLNSRSGGLPAAEQNVSSSFVVEREDSPKRATADITVVPNRTYRPQWKRWKLHMFHALDDNLLAEGNCVGWRQTMLCNPDGPVEPHYSKPCKALVTSGSGYCLCKSGRRANMVGCGEVHFTCAEACSGALKPSIGSDLSLAAASAGSRRNEGKRSMLLSGKVLEELEARGRDIKRRLVAQRALMSLLYPSEQHRAESGKDATEADNGIDAEVARRQKVAVWRTTVKEYDTWTRELSEMSVKQSTKALGNSACTSGWRSTSDCVPHGKRQPELDRGCGAVIRANSHSGGYCECNKDANVGPVYIGCRHRAFTCGQVCSPSFDLKTLLLVKGEDVPDSRGPSHRAGWSEATIRNQVQHEELSSRSFGAAHLKAVSEARRQREEASARLEQATSSASNEPSPQRERLLGSAIAHALGKDRGPLQADGGATSPQNFNFSGASRPGEQDRHALPYRQPDVLVDKDQESRYYQHLDRIQSDHEKKKRVEAISDDDKDRL